MRTFGGRGGQGFSTCWADIEAERVEDRPDGEQIVPAVVDEKDARHPGRGGRCLHRSSQSRMRDNSWLISTGFVM
jgi:hypothetical protein